MVNTITDPQVRLIRKLKEERELPPISLRLLESLRDQYRHQTCSVTATSAVIGALLLAPKKSLRPGVYEAGNGYLYRVYFGQKSGLMLCKRIARLPDGGVTYVYVGIADLWIRGARRLTREEVVERTLAYGSTSCMVCGRRLDDPESVDRGIGPVCWENYS